MAKFTTHDKVNILTLLLSGERKISLCRQYGIDKKELTIWEMRFRKHGLLGLRHKRNRNYPEERKRQIVASYLSGNASLRQTAVDYDISLSSLKNWLKSCK